MRVVFVDNLLFEDAEGIRRYILQPHLGLLSLIAVLEGDGHEGLLLDPKVEVTHGQLRLEAGLYERIARRVVAMRPDAVGFTSLGCNFICTAKAAAHVKRLEPDVPILLGGPHATVLDRAILERFPQFDVVARNEAECTILPLLAALAHRAFDAVPGITFRRAGTVCQNPGQPLIADLDTLPFPAYHRYPVHELGLTSLRVDAGRGCPFQCTFCSTAAFFGRKYRLKTAARLAAELDRLHAAYGITDFALTHDLFTVNRQKVGEFCDAIAGRGYTWKCSARMDCVDDELLERMGAAGCRSIYYGIEAGSARMQKISRKHLDLGLFDPILDVTGRVGMSATVSFITGYPEETEPDQEATLDLIGHCFHRRTPTLNVQLHLLTPEPGTELLNQYAGRIRYDGHVSDFNFPALEPDDDETIEAHPEVFVNHHYFPSLLARRRHVFVTTTYQVLYALGFPLLRYVLRRFDGRLSGLVDSMYRWAEGAGEFACDQAMVERYFAARFGSTSHLTGLVRYMMQAAELRRRAMNETAAETAPVPGGRYRLSPRSGVLRRAPDCPRILDFLVNSDGRSPQAALLRSRYDFLLHLARPGTEAIRNFVLTDASASLLEYFRRPRTWPDAGGFERETGYPAPPSVFLEALVARGVLEATSADATES